ncbi:AAA family ATPase [Promicromonospora sp. NPDC057488]|uniref:ParA family protein n=1 Tax=Promicromonospora sp. NPDC057488 TaxID=3346147 RepID=UPI0036729B53
MAAEATSGTNEDGATLDGHDGTEPSVTGAEREADVETPGSEPGPVEGSAVEPASDSPPEGPDAPSVVTIAGPAGSESTATDPGPATAEDAQPHSQAGEGAEAAAVDSALLGAVLAEARIAADPEQAWPPADHAAAAPAQDTVGPESVAEDRAGAEPAAPEAVPSSVDMAPPAAEIVSGRPRHDVWGQDRPDPDGKNVAVLNQLIESVTQAAPTQDDESTHVAEVLENDTMMEAVLEPAAGQREATAETNGVAVDPDLMEELPNQRIPEDAIKRASEALDAAVNAAPAVFGSSTMVLDDEMVEFVDAEFTHFDGETAPESEPDVGGSDYSVRVTDPIPVQGLSAPGVSRETPGSAQTPNGTQQPTGGPHGGDDERRSALIATVPAVDETTPVAAELAMDARRRIELQGRKFPRPPKTRIITVANQKGGVGKTTTTVNIAAGLAQSGLNVLVIDNDPQGNASTALGIEHRAGTPSVYEILVEGEPLANTVQECPDIPNLWGVPATIDLSGSEIELISLVSRETRLRKALDKYLDDRVAAGEERIDYVLIDCPPSLGLLTVNAFVAGREVFIPVQCEYYALEGLSQLLKTIDLIRSHLNPELRVSSILLTMYDGRTNLAQQVAGEVRSHFPAETFKTTIPRSVRISEAPSYGQTVMTYDPTSTGALAYLQSSRELAERGQGGSSPRRMKAETVGAQD